LRYPVEADIFNGLLELQRQLERKTAHERGEGAEIDLFEKLKSAFAGDRIRRVVKGTKGSDIIHEVLHKGKVCGQIVYDAKNRDAWRNDYVTKLREDQIAAKAEHAILSSHKFPADARQLHLQEGVIIANPARVLAVVEILRRHILQTYELRMSHQERDQKTEALYAFITSERCGQLLDSVEIAANKMLELDQAELRTHKRTWDTRRRLITAVQKANSDLSFEIERIIGTAAVAQDIS
jgi:hypothetical protein